MRRKRFSKCILKAAIALEIALTMMGAMALPGMMTTVLAEENKTITCLGVGAISNPDSDFGDEWSYVYYGKYEGTPVRYRVLTTFAERFIQKAKGKITAKNPTVKYNKVKNANQSVKLNAKTTAGKMTYKVAKYPSGMKTYVSVSKKGIVKIKKGAKTGKYKITITSKATKNYTQAKKTVTITVK